MGFDENVSYRKGAEQTVEAVKKQLGTQLLNLLKGDLCKCLCTGRFQAP